MLIRPARGTKAFTLLELIVVIVILGILAALAIPTFARVTKRAQDSSTATTLSSVLRDARALVAFGDGTTWAQAVDTAVKETSSPVAAGISARAYPGVGTSGEPTLAQPVYAASADVLVLSMKSGSGNVCIGAVTMTSSTTPTCLPALSSGSSASAVLEGRALSDGVVVPLPTGAAPAVLSPSSPTGVSATATGPNAATVNWVAPSTNLSAVSSYRVVLTPATGTALTFTSAAGTTSYAVTSLSSSTAYSVTVVALATAPAVASAPSAAVTVTTPAVTPNSMINRAAVSASPGGNAAAAGAVDGVINAPGSTSTSGRYEPRDYAYTLRLPFTAPTAINSIRVTNGIWGCAANGACDSGYSTPHIYINKNWSVVAFNSTTCSGSSRTIASGTSNPGAQVTYPAVGTYGCVVISAASTVNWLQLEEVTIS